MKQELKYALDIQKFAQKAENQTLTTDIEPAISLDFSVDFADKLTKLQEILGITDVRSVVEGTVFNIYGAEGKLEDGAVKEGEIIPLSKIELKPVDKKEIKFNKYRKAVTFEAIKRSGRAKAINRTDAEMLKQSQRNIRSRMIAELGKGKGKAEGKGFQDALAQTWGVVQTVFEDSGAQTVAFANPTDVADYLGGANVSIQNVFGLSYVENFVGATVFVNSEIPKGKIYGTAPENLALIYIDMAADEDFGFTTDETGFIGMLHTPATDNVSVETLLVDGLAIFPKNIEGVVITDIKEAEAAIPETRSMAAPKVDVEAIKEDLKAELKAELEAEAAKAAEADEKETKSTKK